MKLFLGYGISSLDEMRNYYNTYSEGGMLTGNSRAYGGNLFDGTSQSTQQMIIGNNYWKQQANKPTWIDTLKTPIDGGQLPEIIVTPTNDQKWLFSSGKYVNNGRKPFADSYTKKVAANYLSQFDNESAKDYNARITRLTDAIFTTNGVIFQKNDRKNKRAYYVPNTKTAKISNINDVFAELAHPYQKWLGNNRMEDEFSGNYDNDKDPRGGTRYAYPDTFEGETHGFFEPALKEWIETGKIGRSLPILDERLSNQKIIPKNVREVTDSAASWNKQAIDNRIISMPSQLSLSKRIQYNIFDYPLLDKKKSYGGNLFEIGGPEKKWKALDNIEYKAIPDTAFTKERTGAGSIEYFPAEHPEGITYNNGYYKPHPSPGNDVILYNPKENDAQDIRLDALHIMPKDATYDALNTLYRNAALDSDVSYNAKVKYDEDVRKYGKDNVDSYEQYYNNEADGLLRNMFIEGTPEYIKSKRYYPNKSELREWNKHLLPYIDNIQNYLETGQRPSNILPEVTVKGKRKK